MPNNIRLALVCAVVVWLAGCVSPANKQALVVGDASFGTRHPYSVSISTSGGVETSATGYTNIANEDLADAIEESITTSGLFSSVNKGDGADYKLNVSLVSMPKSMFGISFTILGPSFACKKTTQPRMGLPTSPDSLRSRPGRPRSTFGNPENTL